MLGVNCTGPEHLHLFLLVGPKKSDYYNDGSK